MATSKLGRTARLFHALSDETRLRILDRLERGERCVCELTDALDAAQSRLSFHLQTLRAAGLVEPRRRGRWVYYRIRPEAIAEIEAALAPLRGGGPVESPRPGELAVSGCC